MLARVLLAASAVPFAVAGAGAAAVPARAQAAGATTLRAAAATGTPAVTFVLSGHGWGHGVGMSQWGARGYALHGWSYRRILAHYYPGTTLGAAPVKRVRVLLVSGKKTLALSSPGPWSVVDGAGGSHPLDPGKLVLRTGLAVVSGGVSTGPLPGPLSFVPQGGPLAAGGKTYRGTIAVSVVKNRLQAVDVVGLDDYLRGVVPAEMPSTWPAEALEAQAVAARSYALAQLSPAKAYDLFADVRDQIYGGVAAETHAASAAVDATAGQVALYGGRVADTLFSSSSGGRTASYTEAFPDAKPVPYLVSVADPYDTSPYVNWGPVTVTGAKLAKALGLEGAALDLAPSLGPSGRVASATLQLRSGATAVVTGATLRAKLGLRSTWFGVGLLRLEPPAAAVPYGSAATVRGVVRGLPAPPVLEQRTPGGSWTAGPAPQVAPDGSFTVALTPAQTTQLRLQAGTVTGGAVRVAVAPRVTLQADLSGSVQPVVPDALVDVQLQQGLDWLTVAQVQAGAGGGFSATGLAPGTYRAVYAPGAGLVQGASAPVAAG